MRITVPPDLESALTEQARKKGKAPEDLALDTLRERFPPVTPPTDTTDTLADYLADHIGVLGSSELIPGGADMSSDCGRKFADALTEKSPSGPLRSMGALDTGWPFRQE